MMRRRWLCIFAAVAAFGASCGNSSSDAGDTSASSTATSLAESGESGGGVGRGDTGADTSDTSGDSPDPYPHRSEFVALSGVPGVTDSEIRIGGLASVNNPLQAPYGDAARGAEVYFDQVNEAGGIYGRELTLAVERDDETVNNQVEVTKLLSQDDVFAVAPVSVLLFTGASELVEAGVPTFGWNIQEEFQDAPNMYGMRGYVCFDCSDPLPPWLAQDIGATKIAVLAFGAISQQSKDCATRLERGFEKFPVAEIAYEDLAVPYGNADYSVQVGRMKDEGVDLVAACMDSNAVALLAEEMAKQEMDAIQYIANGYDADLVAEFADPLEGSLVMTQFATFEVPEPPEGLERFLAAAAEAGVTANEQTLAGWVAADMVHTALLEAGPEFDRSAVIDAMNQVTDYDADAILPDIDWTQEHYGESGLGCFMISEIVDGAFVPRYGEPGKPFICLDLHADELPEPVLSD
jgi:ABC-type branched-subunit amino acid transport system substrate-binding protein